jgi:hypothetical protein
MPTYARAFAWLVLAIEPAVDRLAHPRSAIVRCVPTLAHLDRSRAAGLNALIVRRPAVDQLTSRHIRRKPTLPKLVDDGASAANV